MGGNLQRFLNVFKIEKREVWSAKEPKSSTPLTLPAVAVVYHHTKGEQCSTRAECIQVIQNVQKQHMEELNLDDIKYNFLIGGDGRVYEGRGWAVQGQHIGNDEYDSQTIGIAFIGNFHREHPSRDMKEACRGLLYYGVRWGKLRVGLEAYIHADFGDDIYCPGAALMDEYFSQRDLEPNDFWGKRTYFGKLWDNIKGME